MEHTHEQITEFVKKTKEYMKNHDGMGNHRMATAFAIIDQLQQQRKDLLAACKAIIKFDGIEDSGADDGDGYFDTWQSGELESAFDLIKEAIAKAEE